VRRKVGLRSLVLGSTICERTVIEWRFLSDSVHYCDNGMAGHPPRCFGFLMASFKYSARICRMAMRFVKARFEKHLRVPFLHTL
jgi:hypothetical protein